MNAKSLVSFFDLLLVLLVLLILMATDVSENVSPPKETTLIEFSTVKHCSRFMPEASVSISGRILDTRNMQSSQIIKQDNQITIHTVKNSGSDLLLFLPYISHECLSQRWILQSTNSEILSSCNEIKGPAFLCEIQSF